MHLVANGSGWLAEQAGLPRWAGVFAAYAGALSCNCHAGKDRPWTVPLGYWGSLVELLDGAPRLAKRWSNQHERVNLQRIKHGDWTMGTEATSGRGQPASDTNNRHDRAIVGNVGLADVEREGSTAAMGALCRLVASDLIAAVYLYE